MAVEVSALPLFNGPMKTLEQVSVLIVDSQAGMRTQLRNMLGMCGIVQIQMAVTAGMAIRKLRDSSFDIILCEYNLGEGQDGQHFLEDIRQHHLIPLSTIFIMVTGEGGYEKVVSAAELAPQDYILKPFTATTINERLLKAMAKRDAFLPVYLYIERGAILDAIELCKQGELDFPQYLIDFMRLRAELYVLAGQPEPAEEVYQLVMESRAVPWAKLGLAKAMYMQKRYDESEQMLTGLVTENEHYLDAYDWLAKTKEAIGKLDEARDTLNNAVKVSPHTVKRLRKLGEVSIELGDMQTAEKVIGEVVRKGKYSDFRDPEDHVNLAKAQLGMGDTNKATATLRDLEKSMNGQPKTPLCRALTSAMVATQKGETVKAAAALEEAMRHNDPRMGASLNLKKDLAKICLENKMDDQASEVIMDIMRHAADDEAVDKIKGMLTELGRADLGEQLATQLKEEVRDIMGEGARLAKSGDYDGSVRQMMQAVHKLPGNTQVLFNAALALLKHVENCGWNEKFIRQAQTFIERVRSQDPGNARLSAVTAYYQGIIKRNETSQSF